MKKFILLTFIVLVVLASGCITPDCIGNNCDNTTNNNTNIIDTSVNETDQGIIEQVVNAITNPQTNLKSFESEKDFKNYLEARELEDQFYGIAESITTGVAKGGALSQTADSAVSSEGASDYSETNIQVEGVDEADIVKNDGKYIYIVSNNRVFIVDAYPASQSKIISTIETDGGIHEIFINGDKLIVFGMEYQEYDTYYEEGFVTSPTISREMAISPRYDSSMSFVRIYDITDREHPVVSRSVSFDGNYFNSRMIGDYVYVIFNQYMYYRTDEPIPMPRIIENGETTTAQASDIHYFDDVQYPNTFTRIISIDVQRLAPFEDQIFLTDNSQNMYVSQNNIFLTYQEWGRAPDGETTIIQKFSIENGNIQYQSEGSVPGQILNQFSMDEFDENFRIATTVRRSRSSSGTVNNLYILNKDMKQVGSIEDLAPGESIYSARFMGPRAYIVTFQKIDPLFVIDLSNPYMPKVLGKLKIPGYSDYLHPFDENHIIGIGKETIGAEEGNFAWRQGVKLSLFDVSDVTNPIEKAKIEIGDRGTESIALQNHKAFLFSREKNLLVIPITLAEIDENDYSEYVSDSDYGEYTFQGAFVFELTLENGFVEKGRVSHTTEEELLKSGHYYYSDNAVLRSLYMDNTLYTISNNLIKANDLTDMNEIAQIDLQIVKHVE